MQDGATWKRQTAQHCYSISLKSCCKDQQLDGLCIQQPLLPSYLPKAKPAAWGTLEMKLKMKELCQPTISHTLNELSVYIVNGVDLQRAQNTHIFPLKSAVFSERSRVHWED